MHPALRSAVKVACTPFLNRAALKGETALAQMADDFRVLAANAGGVTEDDLRTLGWPLATVASLGRKAAERAYARALR
jgi:hypothetical protein